MITDRLGLPVAGVPVTFTAHGGGSIGEASDATDKNGIAYAVATLGSYPGSYLFTAQAAFDHIADLLLYQAVLRCVGYG